MISLEEMTLRQKVGQLFMIRPEALEGASVIAELEDNHIAGDTRVTDRMRENYAQYPCGGFAIFAKNILSPDQLRQFTADLHAMGQPRPLLSIDEEGGRVARIANHPAGFGARKFPPMQEIAERGDPELAHALGRTIGAYLRDYGLDIDLAPVADVNTDPENMVIGNRAFGSDPEVAARMVPRVVEGLHESGILSCVKHFPGSADTAADTHVGYAETKKTWAQMRDCEMVPFRAGIAAGTEIIMAAHISAPNVTGSREPATLSHLLLTEKLRGELGFGGVIMTDALAMGAIRETYTSPEAAVMALKAGADILLMPYDYFEAFDGVVKAVEEGILPESRLEESVRRIMNLRRG